MSEGPDSHSFLRRMNSAIPGMTLHEKLTMLPGRVAVLTDAEPEQVSEIQVPGWVIQKMRNLGLPPHQLIKGEVVAIGYCKARPGRRGLHPSDLAIGDLVGVMPLEGRVIGHRDEEHLELGELVPPGKQLRLFGALQDWSGQVVLRLAVGEGLTTETR